MTRRFVLAAALACAALLSGSSARADDSVHLTRNSALLGEQVVMTLRVTAPRGATVELTPGTPSWTGVELAGVESVSQVPQGDSVVWVIEARVAPFLPGEFDFAPSVAIVQASEARNVTLPAVRFTAVPTLGPDAELALTPLPGPVAIGGAESPLLRPAIVIGALLGAALLGLLTWFIVRRVRKSLRRPGAGPAQRLPDSPHDEPREQPQQRRAQECPDDDGGAEQRRLRATDGNRPRKGGESKLRVRPQGRHRGETHGRERHVARFRRLDNGDGRREVEFAGEERGDARLDDPDHRIALRDLGDALDTREFHSRPGRRAWRQFDCGAARGSNAEGHHHLLAQQRRVPGQMHAVIGPGAGAGKQGSAGQCGGEDEAAGHAAPTARRLKNRSSAGT